MKLVADHEAREYVLTPVGQDVQFVGGMDCLRYGFGQMGLDAMEMEVMNLEVESYLFDLDE